jgi:pimeloyl-ACP methyl ester carboxylesterase
MMLDQLGYAQADVLGISWGGGLAQQFALSRRAGCAAWCWWRPRRAR